MSLSILVGCKSKRDATTTISFLDPEWSSDRAHNREKILEDSLLDFTRQTGIHVKLIPAPEDSQKQLELTRALLAKGTSGPDVYAIDMVWAGVLSRDVDDLKSQFPDLMKSEIPELVDNYVIDGRLVGVPYNTNVGVLYFRTDLLHKYGFVHPPETWDELEKMALRIQEGERHAGRKDFWGYVWPGAANESLTCNALEWQEAEGGGRIVTRDRAIDVMNPATLKAWNRAAHWIGWISPPSVIAYREWDVINALKGGGRAAFIRTWTSDYFLSHPANNPLNGKLGVASLPGPAVLGGTGLVVSQSSIHQEAALRLVRFLLEREQELETKRANSPPPNGVTLYDLPPVLKAYSHLDPIASSRGRVFARPSTILAEKYQQVSQAYYSAVYSVLTQKRSAAEATSLLEDDLEKATSLRRK